MILQCQVASDVGSVRTNNEDIALLTGGLYRDAVDSFEIELQPMSRFTAIVADGMGGYEGGEIASEMAVKSFDSFFTGLPAGLSVDRLVARVKSWVAEMHAEIISFGDEHREYAGMGTTMVGMFAYEGKMFRINIGDSRLYRFRNGMLKQLSVDHSMRELTGDMSQPSNLIYNSLGAGGKVFADVEEMTSQLISDDRFLICSDGLSDMLSDEEIASLLIGNADVEALVAAAKQAGGRDNISVILLTVCEEAHADDETNTNEKFDTDMTELNENNLDDDTDMATKSVSVDRSAPSNNANAIFKPDKTKNR